MICEMNLPSKIEPNWTLTDLTLKETHLKTYPTMKAINIERKFLMIGLIGLYSHIKCVVQ